MASEYKVVRSYSDGSKEDLLQKAFDDGWQFVRASEYVPDFKYSIPVNGELVRFGYIEYILKK